MTRFPVAIVALALAATPAVAADPRLKSVRYDADKVVQVQGRLGYQSMIEFGPGERIENVAVGDSAVWQVTPNKRADLLFLKPLRSGAKTNMTVVTSERVYLFDLAVAGSSATPLYNLRFTYGSPKPTGAQRLRYPNLLTARSAGTPAAGAFNFDWKRKGKKDLLPLRSFDDGRSLYLQFRTDTPMPALFTRGKDGKESPVNFTQSGAYIVIDQVPRELVMRHGKRTALLINRNPRPRPEQMAER